jgi:succinate-acetate transporter protein
MNDKLANPKVVGYAAIFITGWMYSMYNAGWFMKQPPHIDLVTGLIIGGVLVAVVGILSFFRGETYETSLFLGLGAFFFTVSLAYMQSAGNNMASADHGWLHIVFAVFFFFLWLGAMKKGLFVNLFLLGLWLTFLALAISNWTTVMFLTYIAGYLGLITSLLAAWLSASDMLSAETDTAGA